MLHSKEAIKELMEQYWQVDGNEEMQKDIAGALVVALFSCHEMEMVEDNLIAN